MATSNHTRPTLRRSSTETDVDLCGEALEHLYDAKAIADALFVIEGHRIADELRDGSFLKLMCKVERELSEAESILHNDTPREGTK